jgi:hypothetical protein
VLRPAAVARGATFPMATLMSWLPTAGFVLLLITIVARRQLAIISGFVSLHGLGERVGFAAFVAWLTYWAASKI